MPDKRWFIPWVIVIWACCAVLPVHADEGKLERAATEKLLAKADPARWVMSSLQMSPNGEKAAFIVRSGSCHGSPAADVAGGVQDRRVSVGRTNLRPQKKTATEVAVSMRVIWGG